MFLSFQSYGQEGYMKKNKILKKTNFYLLLGLLNIVRLIIKISKKTAHLVYSKIDWRSYNKKNQKTDAKAEKWAKHNKWFGHDETMTRAAFQIHQELTEFEGVDPKSKKYYNEIDKRIYDQFKDRIKRYYSVDN